MSSIRKLGQFSKIITREGYDLILTEGDSESVNIVTENISADKILTNINNETLTISTQKGQYSNIKVKLYITFKHINSIASYGSRKIQSSLIKSNTFTLVSEGSSIITILADTKNLNISIRGSGEIILIGSTNRLLVKSSGSGKLNAFDLIASDCKIDLSGSGVTNVNVKERLHITSSGSGDVYYKGDPLQKEINKTDPGNVEPFKE